jgi:DNA-binding response OmpR family regulator
MHINAGVGPRGKTPGDDQVRTVTGRSSCASVKGVSGESLAVLVIDDEPSVSMVFERLLRKLGHSVEVATTAADGLLRLDFPFDVFIIDKNLPDSSGVEVARAARKASPQSVILMVTGFASVKSATELVGIADDYLTKPFELDQVRETISSLVAQRRRSPLMPPVEAPPQTVRRPGVPHVHLLVDTPADEERLVEVLAALDVTRSLGPQLPEQAPDVFVLSGAFATFEVRKVVWAWQTVANVSVVMLVEPSSIGDAMAAVALKARHRLTHPLDVTVVKSVLEKALAHT